MNTTLRNAFKKAEDKHRESIIALQAIDKHLAFQDLEGTSLKYQWRQGMIFYLCGKVKKWIKKQSSKSWNQEGI